MTAPHPLIRLRLPRGTILDVIEIRDQPLSRLDMRVEVSFIQTGRDSRYQMLKVLNRLVTTVLTEVVVKHRPTLTRVERSRLARNRRWLDRHYLSFPSGSSLHSAPVVSQPDPAEARRARLLALGWPTSAEVAARAGNKSRNADPWAKDKRHAGQLLGVWDATVGTFRHPDFQFEAAGQLRPEVKTLLTALGKHPDWTGAADANGWRRAYWLYQPVHALSRAALAFAALHPSGQGSALQDDPESAFAFLQSLQEAHADPEDQRARTPAEVFAEDATAVIALAQKAAAAARPDTDAEGHVRGA